MITIDLLKNHSDCIPRLAEIWQKMLGKIWIPDLSKEEVMVILKDHLNENSLPLTYVAFHDKRPIAMCCLMQYDGVRQDLAPWIGPLVVDSPFQQQGIGRLLIDAVKAKAKVLGFEKLYNYTFETKVSDYCSRLGWKKIGMDKFKQHLVTVMEIDL